MDNNNQNNSEKLVSVLGVTPVHAHLDVLGSALTLHAKLESLRAQRRAGALGLSGRIARIERQLGVAS